ncbi:hypothetical protein [Chryseolinea lacunae]|uniref:Uncharacterized protein n=1 Tax=Chryseolinea lacunae TaxID=2801331 RepID=A0ABS1KZF4_9BACT|nr:hypothetical protein [Chryseolinea lacunae]MBL0744839.1 hypothetical protein [Chryseolinea lacunae]
MISDYDSVNEFRGNTFKDSFDECRFPEPLTPVSTVKMSSGNFTVRLITGESEVADHLFHFALTINFQIT